jgi:cytoskeletal protein CcmA (bactofilin family)
MMAMGNREHRAGSADPPETSREGPPGAVKNANVGRSVCIKGTLSGSEDLIIDGQLEGRIELEGHALTIGPNANIRADVVASLVTIVGSIVGNVTAHDKAEIRPGGSLEGNLASACVAIHEGAFFSGNVAMPRKT